MADSRKDLQDTALASELVLSQFTPYRVVVLGRLMSEQLGEAYAGEGLTIPEWRVLAVVSQADVMTARDVVALTPMDKMTVSRSVAALETKELINRSQGTDKRVNELRLSAQGRRVFESVAALARQYEDEVLSVLSQSERASFFVSLDKLEARARELSSPVQRG